MNYRLQITPRSTGRLYSTQEKRREEEGKGMKNESASQMGRDWEWCRSWPAILSPQLFSTCLRRLFGETIPYAVCNKQRRWPSPGYVKMEWTSCPMQPTKQKE